ncbi:UxaA family hydrolase [Peptoniphilus sp. GNH]|nr:hydrolase, UxaA family [Clostridiales bacterium KA00134]UHR03219.1 UxaA family hydrolase [Peptoniphilus sp. GNH]
MYNATIITESDNVVVAIEKINKGSDVSYRDLSGKDVKFKALDDVTIYHKIARRDIKEGEPIVKYGEHIGFANRDIKQGEHVHEHNCESRREDLEAME